MKGKKPQPKQTTKPQLIDITKKTQQIENKDQQNTIIEKPQVKIVVEPVVIEPPKPKIKLSLLNLQQQWKDYNLDQSVKLMIEDHFKSISQPLQIQIKQGKTIIPNKNEVEDFDKVLKKQKAKLKKQEFEEGLIQMRLKHNLLSQKEYQERKKFIQSNIEQIPDKEKEFQDKLGIRDYFIQRQNLIQSTIIDSQQKSKKLLDLNTEKQLLTKSQVQIGSLTERGKSQSKLLRDKSQNVSMFNFKNEEEKLKHEEFIKKLKDEQKKRKKLRKQLELLQEQKIKQQEEKLNKDKELKEQVNKEQKTKKFLEMQELLAKKEKERQDQKLKQDEELQKLIYHHQPLHLKMESQYKTDIEMPLLEQKKRRLEEIRQFYKQPLNQKEILMHMKKYESEAEAKQREREDKKRQMLREFNKRDQDIYESKVIELDQRLREEEEEKLLQRRQVNERMNEYFESIKGTISFKDDSLFKKKQQKLLSMQIDSKTLKGSQSARGLPHLSLQSQHSQSVNLLCPNPSRSTNRQNAEKQYGNINWKSEFTIQQENKLKKEQELNKIKKDQNKREYLLQTLKKTKKEKEDIEINQYLNDKNISDRERFDLVKLKASQLEQKARLDEQLLVMDENDPDAVQKAIDVNELYIKSIQAKLQMLNAD